VSLVDRWTALVRPACGFGSAERPARTERRPRANHGAVIALAPAVGLAVPTGSGDDPMPVRRDLAHLSDEALVALLARGHESALAELYGRFGRVADGMALRVLRDESLAEDAVQDAFLTLWRTAAAFVPERAKASTWILPLVPRRAVDVVRREDRR